MTEYIHYFWVGFYSMGRFPLFRNTFMVLGCVVLVIVIRRLTASLRSGGAFLRLIVLTREIFIFTGLFSSARGRFLYKTFAPFRYIMFGDATDRAIDIWCIWNVKRGEQLRLSSERVQEIAV